jgi:nitrite reductase/ring-hydroxylating ferredoxin subunit
VPHSPSDDESRFVTVASLRDLPRGSVATVEHAGRTVALFHTSEGVFALDDTCTHAGGPLSEGEVENGRVTCPWHGAVFELTTGRTEADFASGPVRCYDVRIRGDAIEIAARD